MINSINHLRGIRVEVHQYAGSTWLDFIEGDCGNSQTVFVRDREQLLELLRDATNQALALPDCLDGNCECHSVKKSEDRWSREPMDREVA